jgi:methylase of polypeptide subunit release factors
VIKPERLVVSASMKFDDAAAAELLRQLRAADYSFVTPSPETHRRVVARRDRARPGDLRDVFGWSLPFAEDALPFPLLALLRKSDILREQEGLFTSVFRVSTVGSRLFLHSAFPTDAKDSVFFGPDSYRFARFVEVELPSLGSAKRLVDLGTGAGIGGIVSAPRLRDPKLTLVDINPLALRLAAINAADAGLEPELVHAGSLDEVKGPVDLVIANPPFILDPAERSYRHGGDMHGAQLSLDWAIAAAKRLEPGGHMLLYTGSAIVDGQDGLQDALVREMPSLGCDVRYREIDPDIFGEQLDEPGYEDVERIAAVGVVIQRKPC